MPFQTKSLATLLEREKINTGEFAKRLANYTKFYHEVEITVTRQTVSHWIRGINPPTLDKIDLLYKYARFRGYEDLEFYKQP